MSEYGPNVSVMTVDPSHTPTESTAPRRGLLYPLWVMAIYVKPYPGARERIVWFSVDAVRGIPLPIVEDPTTEDQPVPQGARLLDGVDETTAVATTVHFVKKGLGTLAGWMARVRARDVRRVYKLFWIVERDGRDVLVDSRSGKEIPLPEDLDG